MDSIIRFVLRGHSITVFLVKGYPAWRSIWYDWINSVLTSLDHIAERQKPGTREKPLLFSGDPTGSLFMCRTTARSIQALRFYDNCWTRAIFSNKTILPSKRWPPLRSTVVTASLARGAGGRGSIPDRVTPTTQKLGGLRFLAWRLALMS